MKGKIIAFLIWTAICASFAAWAGNHTTKDIVYSGSLIQFTASTSRVMYIDSASVVLEANSGNYFAMQNESGANIVSTPGEPPLGWTESQYNYYPPTTVPGGKWTFQVGSANIKIQSSSEITVRLVLPDPQSQWITTIISVLALWSIGISLVRAFNEHSELHSED